jgi:acyl-CoA thioester hydrolase
MEVSTSTEAPLDRYRGVVLPDWIDYNGHMNLAYYLLAFDHATDIFFDYVGLDRAYREASGGTTFTAEVHIGYRRELSEGDPLRITTQLLSFDAKRLRYFHHMYHGSDGFLAATVENLSLHIDLKSRRVAPFPQVIRDRLGDVLARHRVLGTPEKAGAAIAIPPLDDG